MNTLINPNKPYMIRESIHHRESMLPSGYIVSRYDDGFDCAVIHKQDKTTDKKTTGVFQRIAKKLLKKECPKFDAKKQTKYYQENGIMPENVILANGFIDKALYPNQTDLVLDIKNDIELNQLANDIMFAYGVYDEKNFSEHIMHFIYNRVKYNKPENQTTAENNNLVGNASLKGNVRAMSIAYKYIADIAGIKTDLVKGKLNGLPHAWNVTHYKDGTTRIIDSANGLIVPDEDAKDYKPMK